LAKDVIRLYFGNELLYLTMYRPLVKVVHLKRLLGKKTQSQIEVDPPPRQFEDVEFGTNFSDFLQIAIRMRFGSQATKGYLIMSMKLL
jgi:hypothetical protein